MIDLTEVSANPKRVLRVLRDHGLYPHHLTPHGPAGFAFRLYDLTREHIVGSIIVSQSDLPDDPNLWLHASIAFKGRTPSYDDLKALKLAVFGDGREAYQVFPPASAHVNIHEHALHLWGRADGTAVLPHFGIGGSI